jgi:hypothetical protein
MTEHEIDDDWCWFEYLNYQWVHSPDCQGVKRIQECPGQEVFDNDR